jgi:hypothetical protein
MWWNVSAWRKVGKVGKVGVDDLKDVSLVLKFAYGGQVMLSVKMAISQILSSIRPKRLL